ncbi:hypothetical protein BDV25DRAFT_158913 [Aspergillus avenaceus]|uniref:Solid-state culture expressed protein (Aos23) n=1 Tax=Aspergillus avenaceus TaxID=36643 RepID=A0A5N6TPS1_ASPAV|nr:hypothetical protein BDV25DRAFT_158913 [Aspergillus avenaceus]
MSTFDRAWHTAADSLRNDYQDSERQWNQHGEEPMAGIQGRGTATDPYDAGNRDEQPGAPRGQQNTAVVPEALSSITPSDNSNFKSSNKMSSGAAAMQPELNPTGDVGVGKPGYQPYSPSRAAPEQRDVRSGLEQQAHPSSLNRGHESSSRGQGSSMTGAAAGAGIGAGTAASLGQASSAQQTGLRKPNQTTGLGETGSSQLPGRESTGYTSNIGQPSLPGRKRGSLAPGVEDVSPVSETASPFGQSPSTQTPDSTFQKSTSTQLPSREHKPSGLGQINPAQTSGPEGERTVSSPLQKDTQPRSIPAENEGPEPRTLSSGLANQTSHQPSTSSTQRQSTQQPRDSTTEHSTTEYPTESTQKSTDSTQSTSKGETPNVAPDAEHVGFTPKTDHVSKEALEGPQCPPASDKYEAERKNDERMDRMTGSADKKKSADLSNTATEDKATESKTSDSKQSDTGKSDSGKSSGGTMAHIKEKVEKVIHPHKS